MNQFETGAECIIRFLEEIKTEYISGIPGGANLPLYDALYSSNIQHILARHEQGAGFIAQGISRSSNKLGICFVTSGPGFTNAVTAIADANMDSIPMLIFSGQVSSTLKGTDAFQEVDASAIAKPITKKTYFIQSSEDLYHILPEAFHLSRKGKPGPILIDIPKDIQLQKMEKRKFVFEDTLKFESKPVNTSEISEFINLFNQSKKPLLYIGGGIQAAKASEILMQFARKYRIPLVSSLMGLGAFPSIDPLFFGMLGMHGLPIANYAVQNSDLILAFGVRFDDRATGNVKSFAPNAKIIHVDISPKELGKIIKPELGVHTDIKLFLNTILKEALKTNTKSWLDELMYYKNTLSYSSPNIRNFFINLNSIFPSDTIISTDVGKHQMWTAQFYAFEKPHTLLTSGGLGTMGFGLPVAIGAALANPHKTLVCITGDGSILMNLQELALIRELNLNIKIILLNNRSLGMVKQQQELFYEKRYSASDFMFIPNFQSLAESFQIPYISYSYSNNPNFKEHETFLKKNGPIFMELEIPDTEGVYPIVPPGKSNSEMICYPEVDLSTKPSPYSLKEKTPVLQK